MLADETLLILGAGSSKTYNIPDGEKLKKLIIHLLKEDIDLRINLISSRVNESDIDRFLSDIETCNLKSIDDFINKSDNYIIGKILICYVLIKSEIQSDVNMTEENWLSEFWYILTRNISRNNFTRVFNKLKIITFNYDRTFEWFLFKALVGTFKLNVQEAYGIMHHLPILHVYGKLGSLPWEKSNLKRGLDENVASFSDIISISNAIRTIGETKLDDHLQSLIYDFINYSNSVYFLGFGFHESNLNILNLTKSINPISKIYGTAYSLDRFQKNTINIYNNGILKKLLPNNYTVYQYIKEIAPF